MHTLIANEAEEIAPPVHRFELRNDQRRKISNDFLNGCVIRQAEDSESYFVYATLPCMSKEDIHVIVNGNSVLLGADQNIARSFRQKVIQIDSNKQAATDGDKLYIIHKFLFDQGIEATRAQATYKNGELELILPKDGGAGKRLLIN